MRNLTSQILVLSTSLVTLLTIHRGTVSTVSDEIPTIDFYSEVVAESDSVSLIPGKKSYSIYFDNKSDEDIDVAIRYKEYAGEWITSGFVRLSAGEKKLMGQSDSKVYFLFAQNQRQWRKKVWRGKHKFKIGEKKPNKFAFRKEEIWECYDAQRCNTFAVFR